MAKSTPHELTQPKPRPETLALLKILELGDRQIEAGQVEPAADVFARLRKRHQTD